jgi:NADP-dependent 3-hydroxy acid dehydrogenase YdfG
MKYDKLSERMKRRLHHLKGASSTIANNIIDALEEAGNEREFVDISIERLENLTDECQSWIQHLKDAERDREGDDSSGV